MAAAQSPLRRWKRFFPAFALIDAAIESTTGHPRAAFRSVRSRIAGLLHRAEDDGVAEELCAALDGAMEEALATLRVAASALPPSAARLTEAVLTLSERHESARVRGLARDIVRRWTAAAEADLARASGLLEMLMKLQNEPRIQHGDERDARVAAGEGNKERHAQPAKKTKMALAPVLRSNPAEPANGGAAVKVAAAPSQSKSAQGKKEEKTEARRKAPGCGNRVQSEEMMEATKRKLREGYQQAEDAKRQRKIQVIDAPKMLEQRQKKMNPILRERSRARCGSSLTVRRSLIPTLQRI
ncbi:unnamed protein product [Urochloa decumbens]|uniref:TFIIS N-terminal domain-containing protein n=1 Tax=Urochloa decumbens TaxID=240449 RepID=A0ABC9E562_9POAL